MSHQTKRELLEDLEDRMTRAIENIDGLAETDRSHFERARLQGKSQGVNLARSYVREALRIGGAA